MKYTAYHSKTLSKFIFPVIVLLSDFSNFDFHIFLHGFLSLLRGFTIKI